MEARRRVRTHGLQSLQQENFVEINPSAAARRGIKNWDYVWVKSPTGAKIKVRALVTERVGQDTAFVPFHFSGWWEGKDYAQLLSKRSIPSSSW